MGGGTELDPDPCGPHPAPPPAPPHVLQWRDPDRFSSGICSAIMISGSWHSTAQPSRSPTRRVSTCRKWLGMRLHEMGISICTSNRGGHCGAGFLRSLRNMAADSGMMFWGHSALVRISSPPSCHPASRETSGIAPSRTATVPLGLPHLPPWPVPSLQAYLLLPQLKLDDMLVSGQDKDSRKELRVGFHLARDNSRVGKRVSCRW